MGNVDGRAASRTMTTPPVGASVVYPVTALPFTSRSVRPDGSGNEEEFVVDGGEEDTEGNVSGQDLSKEEVDEDEPLSTSSHVIHLAASKRSKMQLHSQHRAIFYRPERMRNSG